MVAKQGLIVNYLPPVNAGGFYLNYEKTKNTIIEPR